MENKFKNIFANYKKWRNKQKEKTSK